MQKITDITIVSRAQWGDDSYDVRVKFDNGGDYAVILSPERAVELQTALRAAFGGFN